MGRRARHLDLTELAFVILGIDIEPAVGNDAALVEGILLWMAERHEDVIPLAFGKVELRGPRQGRQRRFAGLLQGFDQRLQRGPLRHLVETADPHIDGVDLAPAE